MASFSTLTIEEATERLIDYRGKTPPKTDSGIRLVTAKVVKSGQIHDDRAEFIAADFYDEWMRRGLPKKLDVLLTTEAPLGEVAILRHDARIALAQRIILLRANPELLDPLFLFYALQSSFGQGELRARASGTTVLGIKQSELRKVRIPVCPLPIQRRIAGILSAYDEMIENSQRRIKILESMARALYRETLSNDKAAAIERPFAESTYWRFISENVTDYAGTKRYYATADIEGLAITGAGIDYAFNDKPSRAQKQPFPNSVWFARMKDTYKIAWYGPQNDDHVVGTVLSSGFAGFEARDAELWPLLFLTISSKEFHLQKDLYCTGATQMSLTNEGMARILVPIPDEESARQLGHIAGPMLDAIASLQSRNNNLRRTRDLLLSRLISGELDVEASAA